jgi:quercetin dioxygenase-like cupin family protein
MGCVVSFLAQGEDTDGRFALVEYRSKPGNEPPPHIHEWEHEFYYVLDGAMEFYIGDQVIQAKQGQVVFLPQGKAHAFKIKSDELRALILVVATGEQPVGLDRYFLELAEPATTMSLPKEAVTYAVADPKHAISVGERNGIRILSPSETPEFIASYPGLGSPVMQEMA